MLQFNALSACGDYSAHFKSQYFGILFSRRMENIMRYRVSRRTALLGLGVVFVLTNRVTAFAAAELPSVRAYHNPGCTCCHGWAKHMEAAGFKVTLIEDPDLAAKQRALGVPEALTGCHFARIGPYLITGHVPSEDVLRMLAEKPNAKGLALPGMPLGSPGMEMGSKTEKFSVLIFFADSTSKVFSQH
ncbi:MAG TPA: DUF411 domain-containing protein [Aestuariivirgaceae bacterium]|nr:DUF411 domain-containing protein [Aestuariivirgaceae bacterium]